MHQFHGLSPRSGPLARYALGPIIEAFSRKGEVVLDPFCGSGSTAFAAHRLGRRYIGMEIDQRQCETAVARLRAA